MDRRSTPRVNRVIHKKMISILAVLLCVTSVNSHFTQIRFIESPSADVQGSFGSSLDVKEPWLVVGDPEEYVKYTFGTSDGIINDTVASPCKTVSASETMTLGADPDWSYNTAFLSILEGSEWSNTKVLNDSHFYEAFARDILTDETIFYSAKKSSSDSVRSITPLGTSDTVIYETHHSISNFFVSRDGKSVLVMIQMASFTPVLVFYLNNGTNWEEKGAYSFPDFTVSKMRSSSIITGSNSEKEVIFSVKNSNDSVTIYSVNSTHLSVLYVLEEEEENHASCVAISEDGRLVVIGSASARSQKGTVNVYHYGLKTETLIHVSQTSGDNCGSDVALSKNGDSYDIYVGCPGSKNGAGLKTGSVRVFNVVLDSCGLYGGNGDSCEGCELKCGTCNITDENCNYSPRPSNTFERKSEQEFENEVHAATSEAVAETTEQSITSETPTQTQTTSPEVSTPNDNNTSDSAVTGDNSDANTENDRDSQSTRDATSQSNVPSTDIVVGDNDSSQTSDRDVTTESQEPTFAVTSNTTEGRDVTDAQSSVEGSNQITVTNVQPDQNGTSDVTTEQTASTSLDDSENTNGTVSNGEESHATRTSEDDANFSSETAPETTVHDNSTSNDSVSVNETVSTGDDTEIMIPDGTLFSNDTAPTTSGNPSNDSETTVSGDSTDTNTPGTDVTDDQTSTRDIAATATGDSTESNDTQPTVTGDSTESNDTQPTVTGDSTESNDTQPTVTGDSTESNDTQPTVTGDSNGGNDSDTTSTHIDPTISDIETDDSDSSSSVSNVNGTESEDAIDRSSETQVATTEESSTNDTITIVDEFYNGTETVDEFYNGTETVDDETSTVEQTDSEPVNPPDPCDGFIPRNCPRPKHSTVKCVEGECGYDCVDGFTNNGTHCLDCEGSPTGAVMVDYCGVCGGNGTSCRNTDFPDTIPPECRYIADEIIIRFGPAWGNYLTNCDTWCNYEIICTSSDSDPNYAGSWVCEISGYATVRRATLSRCLGPVSSLSNPKIKGVSESSGGNAYYLDYKESHTRYRSGNSRFWMFVTIGMFASIGALILLAILGPFAFGKKHDKDL